MPHPVLHPLTVSPGDFDAVGGKVKFGAVTTVAVLGGEALFPVVGVGRAEGVLAAGVAAI